MTSFQYFGQHIEIFRKKVYFIYFFICLELLLIRIGRIRIGMPWMPIPIRQNEADPTWFLSGGYLPFIKNYSLMRTIVGWETKVNVYYLLLIAPHLGLSGVGHEIELKIFL